jgi:hypothetical protein
MDMEPYPPIPEVRSQISEAAGESELAVNGLHDRLQPKADNAAYDTYFRFSTITEVYGPMV